MDGMVKQSHPWNQDRVNLVSTRITNQRHLIIRAAGAPSFAPAKGGESPDSTYAPASLARMIFTNDSPTFPSGKDGAPGLRVYALESQHLNDRL